eukprot:g22903.t1
MVVVWRTDLYITEARCQLSDTSSYHPLNYDCTPDLQTIISQTINDHIISGDLPPTSSNLIVPQSHIARYLEQFLFRCYIGTIPHLFLSYIDDCIGTALCFHKLEQFINFTNNFHPNLKFSQTISVSIS